MAVECSSHRRCSVLRSHQQGINCDLLSALSSPENVNLYYYSTVACLILSWRFFATISLRFTHDRVIS